MHTRANRGGGHEHTQHLLADSDEQLRVRHAARELHAIGDAELAGEVTQLCDVVCDVLASLTDHAQLDRVGAATRLLDECLGKRKGTIDRQQDAQASPHAVPGRSYFGAAWAIPDIERLSMFATVSLNAALAARSQHARLARAASPAPHNTSRLTARAVTCGACARDRPLDTSQ